MIASVPSEIQTEHLLPHLSDTLYTKQKLMICFDVVVTTRDRILKLKYKFKYLSYNAYIARLLTALWCRFQTYKDIFEYREGVTLSQKRNITSLYKHRN